MASRYSKLFLPLDKIKGRSLKMISSMMEHRSGNYEL
jgi:hypothetical protein